MINVFALLEDLVKQGLLEVRLQSGFKPCYNITPEGEQLVDDWEYIDSSDFQCFLDEAECYLKEVG
ncbi:hypothetical protein LCGC14_1574600 [marine sediment metagenome]|uniref:ArnR1-like winged helix-turn-helix domain-containing protein n=1 Tax=marine sediment metagenome TaxID=412755 RepID=A0A0F9KZP5_9ZZZZ